MRLGAAIFQPYQDPLGWLAAVKAKGYRAAYCPVSLDAPDDQVRAYRQAAERADIVIAEVGAWSNPLSPDAEERAAALRKCQQALDLAERIGALSAVNISGSRGTPWDGPHPANLTPETFEMIVETTRQIIDAVKPNRAVYALEAMPWMYPDSVDSYLALIQAIDRPACGAHFDPVNLINSPQRYYSNAAIIRDGVRRLAPYLRTCHAKDTLLSAQLTTHLSEVRPGLGYLDYAVFLRELDRLEADVPLMIEHLREEADYDDAAAHIRGVAKGLGIKL